MQMTAPPTTAVAAPANGITIHHDQHTSSPLATRAAAAPSSSLCPETKTSVDLLDEDHVGDHTSGTEVRHPSCNANQC